MAFKRSSFKQLANTKKAYFAGEYKFSKKTNFKIGDDVYVIPLGLEDGYYETPCHTIRTHTVDGQTIGYNGSNFNVYVKCEGYDEEGNKSESLCCTLAKMEKDRIPDKNDSVKRVVSFMSSRIHLPVLILGNSLADKSKKSYPISKVSILNDLKSEGGLKFAYLDMASSSFQSDILSAYGQKLKEEGVLDYEMSDNSEEFYEEIRSRLTKTVIKVRGVAKQGFSAAMKEYSFFPFDNPAIANASPEGEREAIVNYKNNKEIMAAVSDFLSLFNVEVDNIIPTWNEKDLKEYYNSAIGADLKAPIGATPAKEETIEVVTPKEPVTNSKTDELTIDPNVMKMMDEPAEEWEEGLETSKSTNSDEPDFEFDTDDEESFFED